ncbi:hypothetical protein QO008_000079 [Peptoniphilus ivorii]|uniref:hypothetical protein n=1 Tax=Aedoeadaptatus ivorii TaxID=54006 RepID=UPI0027891BB1|nr:hypothetical protein [Peptoniphilus ivorii]MDQ0507642.1 hypothetical protein [Peptoniphilus ivorii]
MSEELKEETGVDEQTAQENNDREPEEKKDSKWVNSAFSRSLVNSFLMPRFCCVAILNNQIFKFNF